ncbi:ThuA domain-containing protein [Cohnella sp. GCM10020058]|uniref:ThuA domain-containing protein n=1 Tax=Cohnella sp. GCM10020058 TaxID=3317330 RepID=UPI00362EFE67
MAIHTLLITGDNNHDWRRTAPYFKKLLEDSGKFTVDLTERPEDVLADANEMQKYRLFFLDYFGKDWGEAARANFSAAVSAGTGVVVLHAANNAFAGWTDYEKTIGLAFREEAGHGEFHEFEVEIADADHPVTRGLGSFRTWDELYHRLVNVHDVPLRVLATAYSAPEKGGSGRNEPMIATLAFGQGRVYHHLLGHVWPGDPEGEYKGASMIAVESRDFQNVLLRGCEWAATGEVAN